MGNGFVVPKVPLTSLLLCALERNPSRRAGTLRMLEIQSHSRAYADLRPESEAGLIEHR